MSRRSRHVIAYLFLVSVVLFLGTQAFEEIRELPFEVENAMTVAVFVLMLTLLVLHLAHIRRAAEVAEAYSELDRLKQEFIAMAGAEMKAPISKIHGCIDELEGSLLEAGQEKMLTHIKDASTNLDDLISDMIESTRLERGTITFDYADFDIEEVVNDVVAEFAHVATAKKIVLSKKDVKEIIVHSDRAKVRRALVNLVSNAIKYTPRGEVSVSYEVDGECVLVHVKDSGIGILKEDLDNLFQKFYRIKSTETESIPGTGLGLWLTRAIMRKLGGNIIVESIKGKGTTFTMYLPATLK